jgi:hypothetical protein
MLWVFQLFFDCIATLLVEYSGPIIRQTFYIRHEFSLHRI